MKSKETKPGRRNSREGLAAVALSLAILGSACEAGNQQEQPPTEPETGYEADPLDPTQNPFHPANPISPLNQTNPGKGF